ncbi:hypothetical protein GD604_00200 [Desulfolutivibrio sulfoxidireducens]|nr:hypothetical protein GD604_00200 [Desulfolutivibrio sulfoxidireducens]
MDGSRFRTRSEPGQSGAPDRARQVIGNAFWPFSQKLVARVALEVCPRVSEGSQAEPKAHDSAEYEPARPRRKSMLPTIKNILYATDLSESARQALRYAVSLAERHQASLTIMHVVRDVVELMSEEAGFDIEAHFGAEAWRDFNTRATTQALATARSRVAEAVLECSTREAGCPVKNSVLLVETGDPAERLLQEIARGGHDLVVMGAHGRSGLMDMLLGGVARKVVRHSRVPVLMVPLPEDSPGDDG